MDKYVSCVPLGLNLSHVQTPRHFQGGAGYILGLRTCKKTYGVCNVVRLAKVAQRNLLARDLERLFRHGLGHMCPDEPREDAIDADPCAVQVLGRRLSEPDEPGLTDQGDIQERLIRSLRSRDRSPSF